MVDVQVVGRNLGTKARIRDTGFTVIADPESPNVDVVFVHGLTGHPRRTWTYKSSRGLDDADRSDEEELGQTVFRQALSYILPNRAPTTAAETSHCFWPEDLLPVDLPSARVLTYGYDTHIRHRLQTPTNQSTILALGQDLLHSLEPLRRGHTSRPLIFVAHSLGGILVKEALRRSEGHQLYQKEFYNVFDSTVAIVFFGTPHRGANPQSIIKNVAESIIRLAGYEINVQLIDSLLPSSERLQELREEFSKMVRMKDWRVYSFQESYGLRRLNGKKVVEDGSSNFDDPTFEISQHIEGNHMQICRFQSPQDPGYRKVMAALERLMIVAETRNSISRNIIEAEKRETKRARTEILEWLRSTDPSINHETARGKHKKLTGEWILASNEFRKWKQEAGEFLWLYGIPGSGKTVLCSTIIEHIKCECEGHANLEYAYFYFDFNSAMKQEVTGLLRSILAQLAYRKPFLPEEILELYQQCGQGRQQPNVTLLLSALVSLLKSSSRTYLIIDALDECSELDDLLKFISLIRNDCSNQVNLLATSRREQKIVLNPGELASSIIDIQCTMNDNDIQLYIHAVLEEDPTLMGWETSLKEKIQKVLAEKAHGMFQYVVLQLNSLRGCIRRWEVEEVLQTLPQTLDQTYDRILLGIPQSRLQDACKALRWLAFSNRPVTLGEVAEAIAIDRDQQSFSVDGRLLDVHSILKFCSSLVTLSKGGIKFTHGTVADEMKELRLSHYSVKEYLTSQRILNGPAGAFSISHLEAQRYMGEECLIYLNFFNRPDSMCDNFRQKFPFLEYAARYWYEHYRLIPENSSQAALNLAMQLFDTRPRHRFNNWLKVFNPDYAWRADVWEGNITQPMYYAALTGLLKVTKLLISKGCFINLVGGWYGGALQAACAGGHLEISELLLSQGAYINARNHSEWTALHFAAFNGHVKLVQFLIEKGADVNAWQWNGQAASHQAVTNGHLEVTELLLCNGANIDAKNKWLQTPLHLAAMNGFPKIITLLLEKGAALEIVNDEDQTPLFYAAMGGSLDAILLLLERGANVNALDQSGWTSLHWAVRKGYVKLVQPLLEFGAFVDAQDHLGRTPLHLAAWNGHLLATETLLNKGADIHAKTVYNQTVLHAAIGLDVLQLLLDRGVDARALDLWGSTARQLASYERRHDKETFLRSWLEKKDGESASLVIDDNTLI